MLCAAQPHYYGLERIQARPAAYGAERIALTDLLSAAIVSGKRLLLKA